MQCYVPALSSNFNDWSIFYFRVQILDWKRSKIFIDTSSRLLERIGEIVINTRNKHE